MITYERVGDLYCPMIVCDACSQRVTGSGNTYWLVLDGGQVHPQIWHTHKWPCSRIDDAIKAQHRGGLVMWEELDRWLAHLQRNATDGHVAVTDPDEEVET